MSNYVVDNSASYTFTIPAPTDDRVRENPMPTMVFGPDTTYETLCALLKGLVVQFHMIGGHTVEGKFLGYDEGNERHEVGKYDESRGYYTPAHREGFDMDRVDFIVIL